MSSSNNIISREGSPSLGKVNQGDCVSLRDKEELFQVIGIDKKYEKCWVRRWPLRRHGCQVFEISIQQISLGN